MSEAKSGARTAFVPGCRFAHPGHPETGRETPVAAKDECDTAHIVCRRKFAALTL
jgi:hypothetical protein